MPYFYLKILVILAQSGIVEVPKCTWDSHRLSDQKVSINVKAITKKWSVTAEPSKRW